MAARDPFEVIRPFVPKDQPPPDPRREFFAEYDRRAPRPQRRDMVAALGLCTFDGRGREVRRGYNCPHFREPKGEVNDQDSA